jgi:hypothetical protein
MDGMVEDLEYRGCSEKETETARPSTRAVWSPKKIFSQLLQIFAPSPSLPGITEDFGNSVL